MARALKYSWTAAVYITAPSADTKGKNVISTITLNGMPRLNTEVCRGAFRKQEEKTGGKKATDKTKDQELKPGNLEDYVVLKDTIQAAAWCHLQSFKDSVSLPEVIGMEVFPVHRRRDQEIKGAKTWNSGRSSARGHEDLCLDADNPDRSSLPATSRGLRDQTSQARKDLSDVPSFPYNACESRQKGTYSSDLVQVFWSAPASVTSEGRRRRTDLHSTS
ncbi:unnamed protein product [Gadus morhua 'NCC']